jgi:26S proteasome non-ATPase regulatory subunit 9
VAASLPGGGSSAPLVDSDGFPVAGVDLFAVRAARQRAAMLRNDCRAAEAERAAALLARHAARAAAAGGAAACVAAEPRAGAADTAAAEPRGGAAASTPAPPASSSALPAACAGLLPFAVVGAVSAGSPAAAAGLVAGDGLVALGMLRGAALGSGAAAPRLEAVAAEVGRSRGAELPVVVLRRGHAAGAAAEALALTMTPREWAGAGLLGCQLLPP